MTVKEKKVLSYIKNYWLEHKHGPTYREIQTFFDLASVGSVQSYIKQLKKKGHLKHEKKETRGLKPIPLSTSTSKLPLLGDVAAGQPLDKHHFNEFVDVPLSLVPETAEDCFVLRVSGDSMIEVGIMDKDLVIIQTCSWVENGTIVIATTQDEASTLKRLFYTREGVELRPENSNYESQFYKREEITVRGKLIGLIRNYR